VTFVQEFGTTLADEISQYGIIHAQKIADHIAKAYATQLKDERPSADSLDISVDIQTDDKWTHHVAVRVDQKNTKPVYFYRQVWGSDGDIR